MKTNRVALFVITIAAGLALVGCSSSEQDATFDGLTSDQRVYDRTGFSLDPAETEALEDRLDSLRDDTGADVIAYVRELDADPDDTLDQVEALQQAWVGAAGIARDTAGAILINREPGTTDEARAGIFLGSTFDDGNVPSGEQEAIVDDALIPPLRDGDVVGSLTAGIDRLESSIRSGPPVTAMNRFADGPGSTWLPPVGIAVTVLASAAAWFLFRKRARATVSKQPPSIYRPDQQTEPAMATALVHRSPRPSGIPATVLALATAGAVALEPEEKGVGIRLLDRTKVRGDVQRTVWDLLSQNAAAGSDYVDKDGVKKVATGPSAVDEIVNERMRTNGWLAEDSGVRRLGLGLLALVGLVVAIGGVVVASAGAPVMGVVAALGAALALVGFVLAVAYSRLTSDGLDAARPWEAYRDGLKQAGKDADATIDLDDALPDIVALGLVPDFTKKLDDVTENEDGTTLRAFASPSGAAYAADSTAMNWALFSTAFVSTSSSGGTVSSGGVGGGGGASGST